MWNKIKSITGAARLTTIDYVLCALLALAFAASPYYIADGSCPLSPAYVLSAICTFLVLLLFVWLARTALYRAADLRTGGAPGFVEKAMSRRGHVLWIAALIFLCWLPVLVFLYPGTLINDTWGQLNQYIVYSDLGATRYLSDSHPIFDTMLMGAAIVPLSRLTGQWQAVIFSYVLIQALLTALMFSLTVDYIYRRLELGPGAALFALAAYCLLPLYPASVQTVSKDALFSWIYVLFSLQFTEFVRTRGQSLERWGSLLSFTIVTLLCCLTKKAGICAVLLSYVIAWAVLRRRSVRLLIPALVPALVMGAVMPAVLETWWIAPGGKQEPLSLPFQMTARYAIEHGDDIAPEEYEILSRVLDMDTIAEDYDPLSADPVKGYRQRGDDEDYAAYLRVWLSQGLRHPDSYLRAACSMLSGWFSWTEYDPLMNMKWRNQFDPFFIPEWVPERGFSEGTAEAYQAFYHALYRNPLFRILLSYGLYAALIPAFALGTVMKRKAPKGSRLFLLPTVFSLTLCCWLAPLSIHFEGRRYLYPLTYTAPLMIMWCLYVTKNKASLE